MSHAFGGGFLRAKTKDAAMKEGYANAVDFAYYNVDPYENPSRSYGNSFRFYDRTFNSEEEAYRFFDSLGSYRDGVCMVKTPPQSALTKYRATQERIYNKKRELQAKTLENFKKRTSATVGCKECGSRITKDVAVRRNLRCPNCGNWLASNSVKEKYLSYDKAAKLADEQLKKATAEKGKARYFAKYEVHC